MKLVMLCTWVGYGLLVLGCGSNGSSSSSSATGGTIANGGTTSNATAQTTISGGPSTGGGTAEITTGGAAGGSSSAAGSSGTGCTGNLEQVNASGLCVANMVTIAASSNYKIDATEVTLGQYNAWLATNPELPQASDSVCGWKSDASTGQTYALQGEVYSGVDAEHHPVFEVDWCDANAYCKAVGKRLCGKIGGGTNDVASFADASASEWYRACSSGGLNEFPYGTSYQASYCDGSEAGTHATVTVGSLTSCQSGAPGYAGVFDLSGNVREWEDSCAPGSDPSGIEDNCRVRGGDYGSAASGLGCDFDDSTFRYFAGYNAVGFRCCAS